MYLRGVIGGVARIWVVGGGEGGGSMKFRPFCIAIHWVVLGCRWCNLCEYCRDL